MKYDSLYSVRKAWLEAIGGDATGADSVYTLSLRILNIYKENPPKPQKVDIKIAVVDDITTYEDRKYERVYSISDGTWYALNSNSEYEEYGIYDTKTYGTTYNGKIAILSNGVEYLFNGEEWEEVGSGHSYGKALFDSKYASYFDTGVIPHFNQRWEVDLNLLSNTGLASTWGVTNSGTRTGFGGGVDGSGKAQWLLTNTLSALSLTRYSSKIVTTRAAYIDDGSSQKLRYGIRYDGERKVADVNSGLAGSAYTVNQSAYIGQTRNMTSVWSKNYNGYMFGARVYDNINTDGEGGDLIHNFVFRNDGKLYDKVTGNVVSNSGRTVSISECRDADADVLYEKYEYVQTYEAPTLDDLYKVPSTIAYVGLKGLATEEGVYYILGEDGKWIEE